MTAATRACPRCSGAIVRDGWDGFCIACGYVPGGGVPPTAEMAAEVEPLPDQKQARPTTRNFGLRHGTIYGYRNYGCRCAECRAAHAASQRRAWARRKARAEGVGA